MRTISKTLLWFAGVFLVIATAFQALAIFGLTSGSGNNSLLEKQPWLLPAWIAALVLSFASLILLACLGTRGYWPIAFAVTALVAALLTVIVTLALQKAFPPALGTYGTQGLTWWRLCYRHYILALVDGLILAAALFQLSDNRSAIRRRELGENTPHFDLSGAPLFRDDSASTIGLQSFAGGEPAPARLKRSRRVRQRKEAEKENKETE